MLKNTIFKIILIVSVLLSPGCGGKNKSATLPLQITDSREYLTEILKTSKEGHYFSGKAKIKISSPGKNFTAKTIFFVKSSSSLHVEMLNFFNQPYLLLVTDKNNLQMYIPSENKIYFDKASPENISRIIGMPIEISELINMIACRPPAFSLRKSKITLTEKNDHLIFKIIKKSLSEEVWVDKNINKIIKYISYKDGSPQMEIKYSSFKQFSNKLLPSFIELFLPANNCRLLIDFGSQEFNSFPDDLFKLTIPVHTLVLPFSAIPAP